CFPYIFRGALDVRATEINDAMKIAAVQAIAKLAREPVTEAVKKSSDRDDLVFGREYIIPTALDERLLTTVAVAVSQAAIDSGVATK
ncbi:MAG: hypothetical protein ACTSXV_02150, partial [Alphaproteobacteria bacterium]